MGARANLKTALITAVILLGFGCTIAVGGTIYVDVTTPDNNDGSSWAKAYKYLQDALAGAGDGNDIWVAEGTYKPDANSSYLGGSGDRTAIFQLINGVAIYGGFAGYWAADPNERDVELYETILSGDINTPDDSSDNSYHVVRGSGTSPTAVLDGFTITAGNGNGGGMYNEGGSPTVTNCIFSGNSAPNWGGGMYNVNSGPTISNCTFSGNSAGSGGGMCNWIVGPTVTNCTFSSNSAGTYGGGMYNRDWSTPMVTNCTFSGNSARYGGGMYSNNSSPTVSNCAFAGNSADYHGGGMENSYHSSATVTNCTFSGNWAGSRGGGMENDRASPTLTNCTFSSNSAGTYGGGMYNYKSNTTLTNYILWGNTASDGNEIALSNSSTIDVHYCDVKGGQTDIYNDGTGTVNWGTGNIDEDPLFIDPNGLDGIPGTADDEEGYVHLRGYSPCINVGDPGGDYSGQVDIDNQPRVAYGRVDMGADEVFPIAGDFEPDGDVDFVDFGIFANNWLLGVE